MKTEHRWLETRESLNIGSVNAVHEIVPEQTHGIVDEHHHDPANVDQQNKRQASVSSRNNLYESVSCISINNIPSI
jgi:hypothetical protein